MAELLRCPNVSWDVSAIFQVQPRLTGEATWSGWRGQGVRMAWPRTLQVLDTPHHFLQKKAMSQQRMEATRHSLVHGCQMERIRWSRFFQGQRQMGKPHLPRHNLSQKHI